MDAHRIETLSAHLGTESPIAPAFEWPVWDDEASRDERFIGYVNRLLEWCQPPHPDEETMFERFARAGIGAELQFDHDNLDDDTRAALRSGVERARAKMADKAGHLGDRVNGWLAIDSETVSSSTATTCFERPGRWLAGVGTTRLKPSIR